MATTIRSDASGTFGALQVAGADVLRFGSDTSGQLAGFRNILINGEVTRINQVGIANWAVVANGSYGYDGWKKIDASTITQIVEAGNFTPSTIYTLSGNGVTTQQLTSPASGNWTLPNIPITATYVQLEKGGIATPFESRPIGLELMLCQRYFEIIGETQGSIILAGYTTGVQELDFILGYKVRKRSVPTITAVGSWLSSNAPTITVLAGVDSFFITIMSGATGRAYYYNNSPGAYFAISARL